MRTIQVAKHHVEISIRRPNGQVEIVSKPDMTQPLFARMAKATKEAGKGDFLSWQWVAGTITMTDEEEAAERSEREYDASTRAVYRAMDADHEAPAADHTPSHKSDM